MVGLYVVLVRVGEGFLMDHNALLVVKPGVAQVPLSFGQIQSFLFRFYPGGDFLNLITGFLDGRFRLGNLFAGNLHFFRDLVGNDLCGQCLGLVRIIQ